VQFQNKRILILRSQGTLKAFSANCPHGDYHMDDGHADNCSLVCPGHGSVFDRATGKSKLKRYRLAMFNVFEQNRHVFNKTC
jgi:nitrite reductase/ring-hydroxylating ferredoxin subunit